MNIQFNPSSIIDFDYSWINNSLTASIGGNDIIEISPVEHHEVDYLKIDIRLDFEKFIAVKFTEWITETGRTYE